MKAFAVIGYHHTGKTTVVTELIKSLAEKGYKVATIKDIHDESYRADTPGKNSRKHIEAGALMTFAKGLYDSSLIFPKPLALREIAALLDCDYLVIEGMKEAPVPKILCAENASQLEELYDDTVFALSGKLTEKKADWKEPAVFNIYTDIRQLTSLVENKVFELLPDADPGCCSGCGITCYEMVSAILKGERQRSECMTSHPGQVSISIDGRQVNIVPFVQYIFRDVILSLVNNLKDIKAGGNISIEIKHHD